MDTKLKLGLIFIIILLIILLGTVTYLYLNRVPGAFLPPTPSHILNFTLDKDRYMCCEHAVATVRGPPNSMFRMFAKTDTIPWNLVGEGYLDQYGYFSDSHEMCTGGHYTVFVVLLDEHGREAHWSEFVQFEVYGCVTTTLTPTTLYPTTSSTIEPIEYTCGDDLHPYCDTGTCPPGLECLETYYTSDWTSGISLGCACQDPEML